MCPPRLILIEGDSAERRHNVFIYLLMMHAGAAAVATCFFLFLPYSHSLDFGAIRAAGAAMPGGIRTAIFLAAFVGFGAKAGLIPLHLWLPRAHPIAPSPVSALMSGIMLKTAIYGFVRFAFDFLGGGPWWSGYVVLIVAAVTGLLGILYAIAEHDLKRLLAYSSVENIGIVFLGLGTSLIFLAHHALLGAALALVAALLHAFNHALFKSLLFLGAGAISNATHSVDLNELGGLQRRMPLTGSGVLIGCCSIAGLPLFNGFISEWLTFRSFLAGSSLFNTKAQILLPLMVGVLALIGGVAAACFVQAFGVAFLGRPRSYRSRTGAGSAVGHARCPAVAGGRLHWDWNSAGTDLAAVGLACSSADSRRGRAGRNSEHRSHHAVDRSDCLRDGWRRCPVQAPGKNRADVGVRSSGAFEPHAVHFHGVFETDSFCLLPSLQARSQSGDVPRRSAVLPRFHLLSIRAHDLLRTGSLSAIC